MSTLNTSRRSFLATSVAAATVPAAASHLATPANRSAWEAALSRYETAKAAADAFEPEWQAIIEAWDARRPSMDGIQWGEFPFTDKDHVARSLDLAAHERFHAEGQGRWWWSKNPDDTKARMRAAL